MRSLIVPLIALALGASAQRHPDWTILGEILATPATDHDQIVVTAPPREYKAIRVRVEDAPLHLDHLVLHFDDGPDERVEVRRTMDPNTDTPTIYLPGRGRVVRRIELWYRDSAPKDAHHARVIVFGS
jgi:hypothetical protein